MLAEVREYTFPSCDAIEANLWSDSHLPVSRSLAIMQNKNCLNCSGERIFSRSSGPPKLGRVLRFDAAMMRTSIQVALWLGGLGVGSTPAAVLFPSLTTMRCF